ncbi:hypothetical protein DEAC_c18170 [Desulfosporosinus acididurans]|uniref:Uncharacterized protein n=1 Tax=Desulfosporosinus acididurans TaxID=476652 RepID=A0A0J1FTV7_9FIRM|nr:hypothetical protein [Desulfosporosinus acididurans]KLU66418.1 hypothetical protein DEAC_c18170 [Desulfosporosinus acididurans]
MNYNDIAKIVHDSVKNAHNNSLASTQINSHEATVIKKVLSDFEVSGEDITLGTIPLHFWG